MKTIALALCVSLTGACYRANIRMANTAATRSSVADDKMHFSVIGVLELSAPVDMNASCAGAGVAGIHEEQTFLGGFVGMFFDNIIPIFSLMNASVECGNTAAASTAAR